MAETGLPKEMLAVRLVEFVTDTEWRVENIQKNFQVETVKVPVPASGQVLVKMERSPINPSDLSTLTGHYNPEQKPSLPYIPGYEGCGTVVASGGGIMARNLKGKRVALSGNNLWAEYAVADVFACLPLPDNLSWEQSSSAFVNPLTVMAFVDIAISGGHKSIIHTAAASSLGKMLIRYAKKKGIEIICVVRKEEQVKECSETGAKWIVNSSDPEFIEKLKDIANQQKCKLAFDAVGGDLTGKVLSAMPEGSKVQVYGGLSGQPCSGISPLDLIFAKKSVGGFWLSEYIKNKNMIGMYLWIRDLAKLLENDLAVKVAKQFTLKEVDQALEYYVKNMTAGKVLITLSK